ncbi:MAG: YhfC family glutamic-type intramembrane protease [Micropruina glycogenica]|jgi:uncharacterized membrane protein YhfC
MVPVASLVGMGFSLVVSMVVPLALLVFLMLRRAADGTRANSHLGRTFACGMVAFAGSQVLTRMPLMAYLSTIEQPWAQFLVSAPVASVTAGLFEETGRLLAMLWLMRRFHRWIDGVTFGLGHGWLEAVLLVGLSSVVNLALALSINSGQVPQGLPPGALQTLTDTLVNTPSELFYLTALERLSAIALHMALSVLVLGGIVCGRRLLFWALAVLVHGVANLAIVLTAQVAPVLVAELVLVALVAAFWWWYVWPSRSRFPEQVGPEPVARG